MSLHVGNNNWTFSTIELDLKHLREENIKKENEVIQDNSWMNINHPLGDIPKINFDLKTLGLLDGKSFIAGTSLENCNMEKGLEYFHAFTDQILNKHEELAHRFPKHKFSSHLEKIARFRDDLANAISLNNDIESLIQEGQENPDDRATIVNTYAEKLRAKFKNKKQIWLPCSWRDRDNVLHSMMINIDMENGTLILINTGKEIEEYHPRVIQTSLDPLTGAVKEDEKFQQFIKISGIDKKRLNHIDFFKYLVELQTAKAWYGNHKEVSEKNFYESLPAYLGRNIESGISPTDHPEAFMKKDACDSGSMKCLSTMLYYTLSGAFENDKCEDGIESYKQLKYLWQTHALVSFWQSLKQPLNHAELKLLKDIIENVSRTGDKLYKTSLLSEQDLAELHATLLDIKSKLAMARTNLEEVGKTDLVDSHLNQPIPENIGHFQVPIKVVVNDKNWNINQLIQKSPLEESLNDLGKAQISFKRENASSTLFNLQNIRELFRNSCRNVRLLVLNRELENTQKASARKIILDKLAQFVCELPDPSDSFWNDIPQKEITECMEEVYSIMQIVKGISSFVFQNRLNEGYSSHEADVTVILYALYSVNVRLARLQKENRLEGFDFYPQDLLSEIKSPNFAISNSKLQQKLQRIISYFYPKYDLKSQVKETDLEDIIRERKKSLFTFKSSFSGVGVLQFENSQLDAIATFKYYKQFLNTELETRLYNPDHGGEVLVQEDYWEDTLFGRRARTRMVRRRLRPTDTEIQKLEALIGDRNRCNENRFLPKSVYLLQDSSSLCLHHHFMSGQNPCISNFDHLGQNDYFSLRADLSSQHQQDRTITVRVNNLHAYCFESSSGIEDQYLQRQGNFDYDFQEYVINPLRKMKKQNSFIPQQNKLFGLELDASREIQMIGIDPYDAVARVVGFGRRNVDFLKNKFILDFFRLQLFRNGQLLSQMEDKAAFAESIGEFFINAIKHHQQKDDLETCLALAKLANDVKVFITQAGYQNIALPDFRKIVREEFIKQVNENGKLSQNAKWGQKRKIYETLMTFYEKIEVEYLIKDTTLQSDAAMDILGFLIARNMEGQAVTDNYISTTVLLKFKSMLIDHIQDGSFFDRNEIFNSAIKLIDPTFKAKSTWHGGPRVYHNENYIIDIEEGSIIDKKMGRMGTVPANIINNEHFKKIFTGRIEKCTQNGSTFIINEGLENELIVFSTLDEELGFERKIKGKTYRYTSLPADLEREIPILADPKLCCWVCDESDQKRFMMVFKEGKKVFKAYLERRNSAPNTIGYSLKKVVKKNDQKKLLQWVPTACLDDLMRNHLLKDLGMPNWQQVECWVNGDAQNENYEDLAEVKAKELGLSFTVRMVEGQAYLVCQQFPGYYLVKNPKISLLGESLKFLTLENFAGERKVLIPGQPIVVSRAIDSSLLKQASQILYFSAEHPLRWLEFDLKEDTLNTRNVEGRFAQITLLVAQGNYEEAFNLLNKTDSLERFIDDPAPGGAKERTVILHLMRTLAVDHHPAAKAMLLHLIIKTEENRLKYPAKERRNNEPANPNEEPLYASILATLRFRAIPYEALIQIFKNYLFIESNATIYRLTEKQKMTFFGLIEKELNKTKTEGDDLQKIACTVLPYYLKSDFIGYLQKGTTRLGTKTDVNWRGKYAEVQETIDGIQFVESSDLLRMFESSDRNTNENDITNSMIVEPNFFRNKFFSLYHLAYTGTKRVKQQIKRLIKLNSHLASNEAMILERVCKNPNSYPSIGELERANKEFKEAQQDYDKIHIKHQTAENTLYYDDLEENEREALRNKVSKLNQKKRKADSIKNQREQERDQLFARIPLGFVDQIIFKIKAIWKMVSKFLLGHFSIGTKLKELFFSRERYDKIINLNSTKTPVECKGEEVLEKGDQRFDDYFKHIVNKYFDFDEQMVIRNGDCLPEDHPDEDVKKKLAEENCDLQTHRNSLPEKINIYRLKKDHDLSVLENKLKRNVDRLRQSLKTQKIALLWRVNQISETTSEKIPKEIHKMGQGKDLNWDDIRQLTLNGSIETFKTKTYLDENDAKGVMLGVSDYLIKATRLEQMHLTLRAIDKAKKAKTAEKRKIYLQNIVAALKLIRTYTPSVANMHRQWFEVANHYLYRDNQLEKLREIINPNSKNILAEMPTGFGKTDTMVPSANYEKALKGWLVINTWPASLEMINAANIKHQMETSFGRKADRLTFDRATHFTLDSLKFMHEELVKNRKEEIPLNIRSETLRSLELHFLLSLKTAYQGEGDVSALKDRIIYFIKILREIRKNGWSTIDESHVTLDPKDKLIYTTGDPTTLPMRQIDILEEFFNVLTQEPLNQLVNIAENQQGNINEDKYNQIATFLAEHFEVWLKLKLSPEQKVSYMNFVFGKNSTIPEWIKDHPQKSSIALLKGQLSHVLKACLKGFVDENFGLSKLHIKEKEYAISYVNANTPKETKTNPSQFKNPHETMNKTYLTYLNKGLEENQIEKLIKLLQEQADEEALEGSPLNLTKANKFFMKIAPTSAKLLKALTSEDIKDLVPLIKKNRFAIFYYIRHIISPQLKIFPEVLTSTVHNFKAQFSSSLSFSATPQATATHGLDTHFVPMKGTSGQVSHLLLTKCKGIETLHPLKALVPEDALKETLDIIGNNPKIKATIDIGAHFKGLSNKQVADKMREQFKSSDDVQAIIFFEEGSKLFKIMDVATGHLQDPADSQVDPEACQASYDQNRCFGSDLKLAVDAIGLLMSGKNTTKAIAGQGGGRMRLWHEEQSVEVVYPENLQKEIFNDQVPNIKQLLVYWLTNQVKQEQEKNYHSQEQQMDNEIRRALLDKILGLKIENPSEELGEDVDVKEAINLIGKYQDIFFFKESNDPWEMYSSMCEDKPGKTCLKASHQNCMNRVDSLSGLTKNEKEVIYTRLEKYPSQWEEIALPSRVKASSSDLEMECEVLQELNVELKIEDEDQIQEDLYERTPSKWPKNLNLFTDNWVKPTRHSFIIQKLTQALAATSEWICDSEDLLDRHITYVRNAALGFASGVCVASWIVIAASISAFAETIVSATGIIICGAILVLEYGSVVLRYLTPGNPIFRLKDLAKWYLPSSVSDGARFFSSDILVSNNFFMQKSPGIFEQPQKPFNVEQKPLFEVLVVQEENDQGVKDFKFMLIDQNDQVYFRRKLKQHREQEMGKEEIESLKRKIGIFDIQNGVIVSEGKNCFKDNELKDNPRFQELLAQVKFMSGEINYADHELAHIEDQAKKIGIGCVGAMFEKHILPQRPLNKKCLNKNKPIALKLGLAVA